MGVTRLPRKIKKLFKRKFPEDWMNFLKRKEALINRSKNLDLIFKHNYEDARSIFHEILHGNLV